MLIILWATEWRPSVHSCVTIDSKYSTISAAIEGNLCKVRGSAVKPLDGPALDNAQAKALINQDNLEL